MMITSFFVLDIDRRLEGLVGRCAQEGLSFLSHLPVLHFVACGWFSYLWPGVQPAA